MRSELRRISFYVLHILFCPVLLNTIIAQNIKFNRLSVKEGLSNSFVNCLTQDRTGFIWFGTDDGLNRFDGYEIKVYRNIPGDKSSLSENIIWALLEDHSGDLWVGTKSGGLNKYNPDTDKFEHWDLESNATEEINITYIYEDSKKNIWIGTYKNGLYRFIPSQNKLDHWQNTLDEPNLLSDNFITSVIEDNTSTVWIATYSGLNKFNPTQPEKPFTRILREIKTPIWHLSESAFFENIIWMGTLNGLIKFDPATESFIQVTLPENYGLQFGSSVSSVAEEEYLGERILWVGTYGGLIRLNLTTSGKGRFVQRKKYESDLLSNQIHDIILDKSGVLWIATENGVNFYSPKNSKFNSQSSGMFLIEILPDLLNKNLRSIAQTKDKTIWFGTDAGLFGIKSKAKTNSVIQNSKLRSLNVWSLSNGSSDKLWIGTYGQGLKEFNLNTMTLRSRNVENPAFSSAAYNYVKEIQEDSEGLIWIGFWGGGLARLNPGTGKIDHWRNEKDNPASLSYNDVWVIHQDKKGRIWIGTNGGGLDLLDKDKENTFYHWKADKKYNQSLSSNNIYSIRESLNKNSSGDKTILWIGTANGLNKFVINNDTNPHNYSELKVEINSFTVDDGLSDNSIESILEDEDGNLWIGTSSGISFFNIKDEHFKNYATADGLSGSSFNSSAAIKTSRGYMLFGSTNGLNYFDPKRIKESTYSPPVIVTDFQILNQSVGSKNISEFRAGMFNSKEVSLSYNQNDFSFQFTSLDYNAPEMNQYAYHMEGFDQDWIYGGKRRFVTYTNLDPGEYVFEVKATNSDGMWSSQNAKIFININPPFWATWWAYIIYAMAFIGGLAFIRAIEVKRKKKKD